MSLKSSLLAVFTLGKGVFRGLPEAAADRNPIELFGVWFVEAQKSGLLLPEAATLATCTKDAVPSARLVLLKDFDDDGFVFYTNYGSRKAAELEQNPRAALVFYWPVLQRQVRIEGGVARVSMAQSEIYFRSRPRGSQISAWASRQSELLKDRRQLETRYQELEAKYKDNEIPLPDFWGGYRVNPHCIEFWQGRANRLHDRLRFDRDGTDWTSNWLYP
jgi:pyridoxamine 5'-phosphate oxidase